MGWTNLTFNFGTVLTSAKMTQLDDNLDALASGASGAPLHVRAAAGPGAGWGHRSFFDFGDGSDGALTYDVSSSIPPGLYQHTILQINSGFTVDVADRGILVLCATTSITINGTLSVNGMGGPGIPVGKGIPVLGSAPLNGVIGGSGGASGSGDDGGGTLYTPGGATNGEAGSAQSSAVKALWLASWPQMNSWPAKDDENANFTGDFGITFTGQQLLGGAGGGVPAFGSSTSGGDGGGVVILCAPSIIVNSAGVIDADGVAGTGTGGFVSNGGGGGGGAVILATSSGSYSNYGSVTADGGAGGTAGAGTDGGAGGAGTVQEVEL